MHGLAGSPVSVSLTRPQSKCCPGLQSPQGSIGGEYGVGRIQFFTGYWTEGLSCLLDIGQRPPSVPCYIDLPTGPFTT